MQQELRVGVKVTSTLAAISGMLAIGLLLAWLRRRSVTIFAAYRIAFALLIIALVAAGR